MGVLSRKIFLVGLVFGLLGQAQNPTITAPEKHESTDVPETLKASEIPEACPTSKQDWKLRRDELRNSTKFSDILALGQQLKNCSTRADQASFFKDEKFNACMAGVRGFTELSLNTGRFREEIIRQNTDPRISENAYKLPVPMQSMQFLTALKSKDEQKIEAEFAKLRAANPQSVSFRFVSQIGADTPAVHGVDDLIYVTYFPDGESEKYVHYGDDGFMIQMTKVNSGKNGKRLPDPKFLMGQFVHETQEGKEGELLASDLQKEMNIAGDGLQCFTCHQGTRVMPLFPLKAEKTKSYSPDHKDSEVIGWFNSTQVGGVPGFYKELASFLPSFGEKDPSQTTDFIKQCSGIQELGSAKKVLDAMNCSKCHDGIIVDPIKFPFEIFAQPGQGENKAFVASFPQVRESSEHVGFENMVVRLMLSSGHMPFRAGEVGGKKFLNSKERAALEKCLLIDYLGNFYEGTKNSPIKTEGKFLRKLLENPCPT